MFASLLNIFLKETSGRERDIIALLDILTFRHRTFCTWTFRTKDFSHPDISHLDFCTRTFHNDFSHQDLLDLDVISHWEFLDPDISHPAYSEPDVSDLVTDERFCHRLKVW